MRIQNLRKTALYFCVLVFSVYLAISYNSLLGRHQSLTVGTYYLPRYLLYRCVKRFSGLSPFQAITRYKVKELKPYSCHVLLSVSINRVGENFSPLVRQVLFFPMISYLHI